MREYKPKKNAQKQVYHKDRFYVAPQVPRLPIENDEFYSYNVGELSKICVVQDAYIEADTLVVWVRNDAIFEALKCLKAQSYETLSEMSAVDYLEKKGGFEIFYQLLSYQEKKRMRLKTFLKKDEKIESAAKLYSSANWSEREMYDMFGIMPLNHPYPKRILMPDDWVGYPLLKSYPLHGDEAAQWYEVDTIFGKEYRDVIGKEQRDSARIDRYDSTRFSHLGYEVGYGEEVNKDNKKAHSITYQEEEGVLFVTKMTTQKTKQLKERK